MDSKYLIVLFKNKQRYKIIKKYETHNNAISYFTKLMDESNKHPFGVKIQNGKNVSYELGLLELSPSSNKIFKIDEIGRNISMSLEDSDYSMLKIEDYNVPEKIFNLKTNKRIEFSEFVNKHLNGPSFKLVSKLNNKIIIQDDDNFELFSLKSSFDALRFLDSLGSFMVENNKKNCLIVKDTSIEQKKYLYELLTNKGIDKKMLYRSSTTHPKDR